ncbi:S26 family signal peptidase [Natronococcus pandeyae]|uniref:S26 family signal peptidase n=1 Tax=Natronococcus pandeyae TaxID=2055836 RepID=A0A8J8Q2K0_9EURY|nr:S26 family signal peptidase [Natronococcus pandeyae]TYL38117.1 S26 family signal peptidase [Natronococcus pandeyae]
MSESGPDAERRENTGGSSVTYRESAEDDGSGRQVSDPDEWTLVRDVLSSVAIVVLVGLLLFGFSGVWPPLVAVESGSMEPNMQVGDLVVITADDRFVGDDPAGETGVVALEDSQDHEKFGNDGDVVVFAPDGDDSRTPIIHRAHFWVEAGENWVDTKANEEYVGGGSCAEIENCPAPHDGFITKGDANPLYDQAGGLSTPENDVVKPEWVLGKASFRIPWLGYVRLTVDQLLVTGLGPLGAAAIASTAGIAFTGTLAAGRLRRL